MSPKTGNNEVFFNGLLKKDIISIINMIDDKIESLHSSSSKDFLFFNKLLKECYTKVKEVSASTSTLTDNLINELPKISLEIKQGLQSNKTTIGNANKSIRTMSEFVSEAFGTFSLITVPFNNYKQNIFTLKYVLANLNLHISYINIQGKDYLKELVGELNSVIDHTIDRIEPCVELQDNFLNALLDIKAKIASVESQGVAELYEQINIIGRGLKQLSLEDYWSGDSVKNISAYSQVCFANMGEVITYLQYHDIIRQKMEHIQTSQRALIEELGSIANNGDIDSQIEFIAQIPDVTSMQVGQLLYTNKDYQNSIEKITQKLLGVSKEMKKISSLLKTIEHTTSGFKDDNYNEIERTYKKSVDFISHIIYEVRGISHGIENINSEYLTIKDSYTQIFNEGKIIRELINKIEKWLSEKGEDFSNELISRLSQMKMGMQSSSNILKEYLNDITKQSDKTTKLINTSIDSLKHHDDVSENNLRLGNILDNSIEICKSKYALSNEIYEDITISMRNVEYYSFFKQQIEEIVELLGQINEKINIESVKKNFKGDSGVLEKMERMYTMQSERLLHERIKEGKDLTSLIDEEFGNKTDYGDDLELF